ncbi:MAG: dockerin type I repeat-containing protein [bacterium]|nr:dockerin type I repeat-containing protein [bacterium]
MARKWRYFSIALIVVTTVAISVSVGKKAETAPNALELVCQVASVTTALSNNSITIPVNVSNITDSIAGFQLWINISEPSLVKFKSDSIRFPGTDSAIYFAKFDTVGTRIKGWEYIQARILDGPVGALINIIGTADNGGAPIKPPLNPGSGTFLRLFAETKGALGDSICDSATVTFVVNRSQTRFSDQHGDLIAYACSTYMDTTFLNCAQSIGDSCISWFDTVETERNTCWLDTTAGFLLDGTMAFECCLCGDANNSGGFSISDAVFIIAHIFGGGPAPVQACLGDANGSGGISISDAVFLISHIFGGGPAPHCP